MKNTIRIFTVALLICYSAVVNAQISPLNNQYFQNRYLANPAMAGAQQGTRLQMVYKNQWSSMPGAPETQNLSLESGSNKVGLGLNINNEKAGLLNYTKVMGTYAYHLPLNSNNQKLHFGLSLGIYTGNLSTQSVVGESNDPDLVNFNERKTLFDADFGMAYTSEKFGFEATLYNLKGQFKNDDKNTADNQTAYIAAEYAFPVSDWTLKPKVAYRGVKNYTDIIDFGLNIITANENLTFTTIYHSNKSTSLGLSYLYNQKWQFSGFYNTAARPINNYANGTFEMALAFSFR